MTSFVVETFAPRLGEEGLAQTTRGAREAAASVRAGGIEVWHVRSYLLPEDEMCLHVFEGPSADAVTRVAELAGLQVERVVEAIDDGAGGERTRHSRRDLRTEST
jgi:hypothetical protein